MRQQVCSVRSKPVLGHLLLLGVLAGLSLFFVTPPAEGQPWSGILDSTRAINWGQLAGIPGGIPNRTTLCATSQCSALTTLQAGASNAAANSSKINAALSSAPADSVALIPAGTWSVTNLVIPSRITLRGMGTQATILDVRNTSGPVVLMGGTAGRSALVNITGGATAGSTAILLASVSGVSVGKLLEISELNNTGAPYYASIASSEGGSCTWCDHWNGTRVRGQLVEVTAVGGTSCTGSANPLCVGITPLYSAYTLSPAASVVDVVARNAGLEDLQIFANLTYNTTGNSNQDAANVRMEACAYCWIKRVEGNYTQGDHVQAMSSFRGEIRDSYFANGFWHTPGQTENSIFLADKTSGFLVENNIVERTHVSLLLNWGAAGNVFGYNYAFGGYGYDSVGGTFLGALFPAGATHGAHPQFNLFEGNVLPNIHPDSVWGSSSHNTAFRNWTLGTTFRCAPTVDGVRNSYSASTGTWANQTNRAMTLSALAVSYNLVGNVAGSAALHAQFTEVAEAIEPTSIQYDGAGYDWVFGYAGWGAGGVLDNTRPFTTALIHGNYTNAIGQIQWAHNIPAGHSPASPSQSLPASFYRSSKPLWWGALPWPAIGPDVSGGTGPGGHASLTASNPAQACYNATLKGPDGIALFDPAVCYGGAEQLVAPSSLSATVK